MIARWIAIAGACATLAGCSNKLSGDVTIDGQPFEPASCRSGQVHGFLGVELTGEKGKRLRLVVTPTGEPEVILFAGESIGIRLGSCGSLTHEFQSSTINDVRNVKGSAQLDCESEGHTIKGTLSFENCH
jgi:hypothetical protein